MNTLIKSKTRRFAANALLIAAAASAGISSAAGTDQLLALVKYGDLNVATPAGAAVLYSRIRSAAEQVCRPFDGRDLQSRSGKERCMHKAIADAVTRVDQPALLSVYDAKNGISKPIMLVSR